MWHVVKLLDAGEGRQVAYGDYACIRVSRPILCDGDLGTTELSSAQRDQIAKLIAAALNAADINPKRSK